MEKVFWAIENAVKIHTVIINWKSFGSVTVVVFI
jgi:hypothetical protein